MFISLSKHLVTPSLNEIGVFQGYYNGQLVTVKFHVRVKYKYYDGFDIDHLSKFSKYYM